MMAPKRERVGRPAPAADGSPAAPLPASTLRRLRGSRARAALWTLVAAVFLGNACWTLWTALTG